QLRQEVLLARLAELAAGGLGLELLDEIPQLEPAEKIRVGIGPLSMSQVRFLLSLGRAIARVLSFEGGCNDEHVSQTAFSVGFHDHPADSRVRCQATKLAADRRQLAIFVHGSQLKQRLVAVANRFGPWWIEEGEFVDQAEVEGQKLEDDRRKVGSLNLGRHESLAAEIVVFAEQPDADSGANAAAAALPLVGRCLRDRFNRQPLQFAARRVAADARGPGI